MATAGAAPPANAAGCYVIGVDGGTESLRAAVFDTAGAILGSCAAAYDTQFPHPSWAEQRPEDWWTALGDAVRGAVSAAGIRPEQVAAMCLDTTCCTVVALDEGEGVRRALEWVGGQVGGGRKRP